MANVNLRVLLVEDEKLLNWSLAKSLVKWEYHVQPVFTGTEALVRLEKSDFDVVMLDYQLPDGSGLEVARRVREMHPATAIFLITAFQLNELPLHSGLFDVYFNKPLDLQQLHQALNTFPSWRGSASSLAPQAGRPQ